MIFLVMALLASVWTYAQDEAAKVDVNVTKTTTTENWYASPWVWVIGIAVFVLLLVAILRGRK